MLNFYYLSPNGAKVDFRTPTIFSDPAWMRKYRWDVAIDNGVISSISRKSETWDLDVFFIGENMSRCAVTRNNAYEVFDRDVMSGTPGRIYVGEYYLECFVQGMENPEASVDLSKIHSKLSIVAAECKWVKDVKMSFAVRGEGQAEDGGYDYPYDYDYDYASSGERMTINNQSFAASDFIITIYGACVNPTIYVGEHAYSVNGTLSDTEILVIDSRTKTIEKVAQDRSSVSWFGKRNKTVSVFEPIPSGVSTLGYGAFAWDIVLLDERSEPPFETIASELDDVPNGAVVLSDGEYLVVDGGYVCVM